MAIQDTTNTLLVGAGEVDITPPAGTALAGGISPRTSEGVQDPLTIKAVVLESGRVKLAYVLLDLPMLYRKEGDAAVELASERTGIPEANIVWAASHTHTGPYTFPMFGGKEGAIDEEWLAGIPGKFADAVEKTHKSMRPARMSRERGYCHEFMHNRRLKFKDGREVNTWLLHSGEEEAQCLGSAGPVDPEIGILCFDDERGVPIAVLWHYTLHTNTNFGKYFSADYPGVVAARLRERFGTGMVPIFMPGACGDINTSGARYREVGNALANVILDRLEKRKPRNGGVILNALKKEVVVSCRDFTVDQEKRIRDSQWGEKEQDAFRREVDIMREEGKTEARTILQAWRIGEVGFASLPGELFVEWGLKIKKESPFTWTYPVELGADYLGYLVTRQAWEAGGYESLIARSAKPSHEGVSSMVDKVLDMLNEL